MGEEYTQWKLSSDHIRTAMSAVLAPDYSWRKSLLVSSLGLYPFAKPHDFPK